MIFQDPAGMPHPNKTLYPDGNLYDDTHGSLVLSLAPGLDNIVILPFKVAAYDNVSKQMAFFDPKRKEDFLFISGTKMRAFAKSGELPPKGFMEEKAWNILAEYYQSLGKK